MWRTPHTDSRQVPKFCILVYVVWWYISYITYYGYKAVQYVTVWVTWRSWPYYWIAFTSQSRVQQQYNFFVSSDAYEFRSGCRIRKLQVTWYRIQDTGHSRYTRTKIHLVQDPWSRIDPGYDRIQDAGYQVWYNSSLEKCCRFSFLQNKPKTTSLWTVI